MARTKHGLPGIYNTTPLSLTAEDGSALAVNSAGILQVGSGTGATDLGKAEDAAHTSGDVGVMALALRTDTAASSAGTTGDYAALNTDSLGHLWAREGYAALAEDNTNSLFAIAVKPLTNSTYSWTRFQNLGANATLNVKASVGNVFSLYMFNTTASVRYAQLHNTATVPGGGAVPLYSFLLPASGSVLIDSAFFGANGANFSTGIAFACSTTDATYTAATATDHDTTIHYK